MPETSNRTWTVCTGRGEWYPACIYPKYPKLSANELAKGRPGCSDCRQLSGIDDHEAVRGVLSSTAHRVLVTK